jgi:hypothetical protein
VELKNRIGLRRLRLERLKFGCEQFFLARPPDIKRLVRFPSRGQRPVLAVTTSDSPLRRRLVPLQDSQPRQDLSFRCYPDRGSLLGKHARDEVCRTLASEFGRFQTSDP